MAAPRIIAVCNTKGGTGKTTVARLLAQIYPRKKLRGLQVYFCLVEMVAYRAAAYSYYFRRDSGFPCQSDTC